jgi:hypothetical protein
MNTKTLTANWSVLADPFYPMKGRTGYAMDAIAQLSPEEAVRAVMGDEIGDMLISNGTVNAASKVQATLFAAWCYVRLRQSAQLIFPINVGEEFHFAQPMPKFHLGLAGLSFLESYGRHIKVGFEVESRARTRLRTVATDLTVKELASKYELEDNVVKQALYTGCLIEAGATCTMLTYASALPVIEEKFGPQETVVAVDHNWTRTFDFLATSHDVAVVVDWLAGALTKNGNCPIHVTESPNGDGFSVWFDETNEFHITSKDGVFETSRDRRFNNVLLVSGFTGSTARVPESDLSLMNSYGCFIYGLLNLGGAALTAPVPELGQLFKLMTNGQDLPMTSDSEVGAGDADRVYYERYVTANRVGTVDFPFRFARLNGGLRVVYQNKAELRPTGNRRYFDGESSITIQGTRLPSEWKVDRAALLGFNLVRMPRGQFIDGRRSCIQLQHIPESMRVGFMKEVLAGQVGSTEESAIADYLRTTYKLKGDDATVTSMASNHLVIGLSSKLAKLIKRTAMDAALVGEFTNGEARGLKRFGQPKVSNNNWLVESVISAHAIHAAGMATYWGEHPQLVVKHTQTIQPTVPGTVDVNNAVVSIYPATRQDRMGWNVLVMDQPVPMDKGDVIADIPYQTAVGIFRHSVINEVPEAQVLEIRWREAKLVGNEKTLQVTVVSQTIESQIKGRNNIKAMLGRANSDVINHELNKDIAARAVFFRDTNKWLDLVMSLVDVAACTAIKNQDVEGLSLIGEANKAAGKSGSQWLEWSPVLAVLGTYQPLIEWFETKYGRAVWFRHADASGEWVEVLHRMYSNAKGWESIELVFEVPPGATNVSAVVDGDYSNPRTNVLVFYTLDGVEYFQQRAWSYAGTANSPVWQPVKGELSSVRAAVTHSPLMAGVARAVEEEDPDYAIRLAKDGFKDVHKAAVFYAMRQNKTLKFGGIELPMVTLGDSAAATLLQTEELKELVSNPVNAGKELELIAPMFKDVVFSVTGAKGAFSIYLPTVMAQDRNSGFRSEDGMSSLITRLFVYYILGTNPKAAEFAQLAGRAKGALNKLCDSENLVKSPSRCRVSVAAKTMAMAGIPVSEVWVRESARPNSVYGMMQSTYKCKELDGRKVIMSRAPMTTPSTMKVKVIRANSGFFDLIEEDAAYHSPLAVYRDAGDCDGDGRSFTDAEDSELLLECPESIVDNIVARTGSDQMKPGASYWGDHFEVPTFASVSKKRGLGPKNLTIDFSESLSLDDAANQKTLPGMLEGSSRMFKEAVGQVHRLFLTTDLYLSLVWRLQGELSEKFPGYKPASISQNKALVLILAEIYEVPLGGLSWEAYKVIFEVLIPAMNGDGVCRMNPGYISTVVPQFLNEAGMNGSASADIITAAYMVAEAKNLSAKAEINEEEFFKGPDTFLVLAAELGALIAGGKLDPVRDKAHGKLVEMFDMWLKAHDPNRELVGNSITLMQCVEYIDVILPALKGQVPEVNLNYFN